MYGVLHCRIPHISSPAKIKSERHTRKSSRCRNIRNHTELTWDSGTSAGALPSVSFDLSMVLTTAQLTLPAPEDRLYVATSGAIFGVFHVPIIIIS